MQFCTMPLESIFLVGPEFTLVPIWVTLSYTFTSATNLGADDHALRDRFMFESVLNNL